MSHTIRRSLRRDPPFFAKPVEAGRRWDVVVFSDREATRPYFRFDRGRKPRLGCKRIRIPVGHVGSAHETGRVEWITVPAWNAKVATHRYVTHMPSSGGYSAHGYRYLIAPSDKAAAEFARACGEKFELDHIERKVTAVYFDPVTERTTGVEWRRCKS